MPAVRRRRHQAAAHQLGHLPTADDVIGRHHGRDVVVRAAHSAARHRRSDAAVSVHRARFTPAAAPALLQRPALLRRARHRKYGADRKWNGRTVQPVRPGGRGRTSPTTAGRAHDGLAVRLVGGGVAAVGRLHRRRRRLLRGADGGRWRSDGRRVAVRRRRRRVAVPLQRRPVRRQHAPSDVLSDEPRRVSSCGSLYHASITAASQPNAAFRLRQLTLTPLHTLSLAYLLPTPKGVAGYGFYRCLSVYQHEI